jgi:hypothetical protein
MKQTDPYVGPAMESVVPGPSTYKEALIKKPPRNQQVWQSKSPVYFSYPSLSVSLYSVLYLSIGVWIIWFGTPLRT